MNFFLANRSRAFVVHIDDVGRVENRKSPAGAFRRKFFQRFFDEGLATHEYNLETIMRIVKSFKRSGKIVARGEISTHRVDDYPDPCVV